MCFYILLFCRSVYILHPGISSSVRTKKDIKQNIVVYHLLLLFQRICRFAVIIGNYLIRFTENWLTGPDPVLPELWLARVIPAQLLAIRKEYVSAASRSAELIRV